MTPGPAPAVVSAHLQVRGDDGFALCPCRAVQAPPSPIAPATQPARSDHPRHPPQDHRTARARGGLRSADGARRADPIATAASVDGSSSLLQRCGAENRALLAQGCPGKKLRFATNPRCAGSSCRWRMSRLRNAKAGAACNLAPLAVRAIACDEIYLLFLSFLPSRQAIRVAGPPPGCRWRLRIRASASSSGLRKRPSPSYAIAMPRAGRGKKTGRATARIFPDRAAQAGRSQASRSSGGFGTPR